MTFVLDTTGPTVTDKGEDGAVAQSKSFKLFDAQKIDKVTINGVTKDLSTNNWSDVNDIKPGRFGAVEGSNTLIAYDVAGNASTPVTFVLDTTGPWVTEKDGSSEASRSFKLDDGALGSKVAGVRVNGKDFPLSINRWSDANGLTLGSFWGVHAGENTLVAYDKLGNETTVTFTIAAPVDEAPAGDTNPQAQPKTDPTVSGVETPSDAGPVATTAAVAGPSARTTTALAPELARAPFAAAAADQHTATSAVALTDAETGEAVDSVRPAAAAPAPVDGSIPGLGLAAVAGLGALALGGAFGLRNARRHA